MTPKQKEVSQPIFEEPAPRADVVAALFYAKLFEIDPDLSLTFRGNLLEEGRNLVRLLTLSMRGLDLTSALMPALQAQRESDVLHNLRDQDYETVADALIWAIEELHGNEFTPEIRKAWNEAYSLTSTATPRITVAA